MRALPFSILAAALALGLLQTCEPVYAGVVIYKNGNVEIGRIRSGDVKEEEVTVRWPYKSRTDRGKLKIPRFRIRWFSTEEDQPNDEYWEKYQDVEEYPIDPRYLPPLERWKLRNKAEEANPGDFVVMDDPLRNSRSLKLSHIPVENETFRIQKPEGWSSSVDEEITIFLSDKPGADGFRARIHVFSVESAIGLDEDQVKWVEDEIARLADGAGEFKVTEKKNLRAKKTGTDQDMVTRTVRKKIAVMAMRKFSFRRKRSYFFAAYAHEQDYNRLESLFQACKDSMEIFEDQRRKKAGGKVEVQAPKKAGDKAG